MSTTEGVGGPCPRCGGEKCFIRHGTGTWYHFVACSDCYFAYGVHADSMQHHTGGVVTGADVWTGLTGLIDTVHPEKILEDYEVEEEHSMDPWYDFSEVEDEKLDWMVVSEVTLELILKTEGKRTDIIRQRTEHE